MEPRIARGAGTAAGGIAAGGTAEAHGTVCRFSPAAGRQPLRTPDSRVGLQG